MSSPAPDGPCPPPPHDAASWAAHFRQKGPFVFPRRIHQTVRNKTHLSCQEIEGINSWRALNPGYNHTLWDDADLAQFVAEEYPQLLPMFTALPSNVERADVWRYLVLHRYGGVYADVDVIALQPVSEWNAAHGHDAAVLTSAETVDNGVGNVLAWNQFAMAAMPCHPLLASMPLAVLTATARQYFGAVAAGEAALGQLARGISHDNAVIARTGPGAWTAAVEAYARRAGVSLPLRASELDASGGVLAGSVRLLPVVALSMGWETAERRASCAELGKSHPQALVCHQFFGSWKHTFHFKREPTYGGCPPLL